MTILNSLNDNNYYVSYFATCSSEKLHSIRLGISNVEKTSEKYSAKDTYFLNTIGPVSPKYICDTYYLDKNDYISMIKLYH